MVLTLDPYILILSVSMGVFAIMILAFSILRLIEVVEVTNRKDERKEKEVVYVTNENMRQQKEENDVYVRKRE